MPASFQLQGVAMGDSWNVQLPFGVATGGGLARALFDTMLGIEYENIAHAGDSSEQSMGRLAAGKLQRVLPGKQLILASMGGDDFIGDCLDCFIEDNTGGELATAINWDALRDALKVTINDYKRLTQIRDRLAPNALIISHSYGYLHPENMGKGFLTYGPWMFPSLWDRGWKNPVDQAAIANLMLDEFHDRLDIFARGNRRHLHVKLLDCFSPGNWANEVHLNESGCLLAATKINAMLLPWLDKLAADP